MHCCERNKQTLWYSKYTGKTAVVDDYGCMTGEYVEAYSNPVKVRMVVSPASRQTILNPFGIQTPYSHTAITEDMNCEMDEESVVWMGIVPDSDESAETANYRVVGVARSLNHIAYALKRVDTK